MSSSDRPLDGVQPVLSQAQSALDTIHSLNRAASATETSPLDAVSGVASGGVSALQTVVAGSSDVAAVLGSAASVVATTQSVVNTVRQVASLATNLSSPAASDEQRAPREEVSLSWESVSATTPWLPVVMHLTESLGACWEAVIELASEDTAATPDTLLGTRARIQWRRGGLLHTRMGVVRRIQHLGVSRGHVLTRVTMVPSLWTLSQRSDARIFQDVTVRDIIADVLHTVGLYEAALLWNVAQPLTRREYCVQYAETDLDFVSRLLEEEGLSYSFSYDAHHGREVLEVTDRPGATLVETLDGLPVSITESRGSTEHAETLWNFERAQHISPSAVGVLDYDFTHAQVFASHGVDAPRADLTRYEPGHEATFAEYENPHYGDRNVSTLATVRHEANVAQSWEVRGVGNVTGMQPGRTVVLDGAYDREHNGRYLVTAVEHHVRVPEVLLSVGSNSAAHEERYECRVRFVPEGVAWRPARTHKRPTIAGAQTARVVGRPGTEIDTDEHGRVRIEFPWDRARFGDHRASAWMRVTMGPWSGLGFGMVFVPRVGMEVVVVFMDGNPDRPLVVGAAFNGVNTHPYVLPEAQTRSVIRTQSTPHSDGYNELSFEDTAGNEEVLLRAQKNLNELVLHNHATTVQNDQNEQVHHNQSLSVGNDRQKSITHDETVHIGRNRTATVTENEHITVQQNRVTRIDHNETLSVGGARDVTITGTNVESYEATRETQVRHGDALTVTDGPKTTTVHGAYDITVSDRFRVTRGQTTVLLDENIQEQTTGTITLTTQNNFVRIEPGGVVTVGAQQRLTLSCGSASIVLFSNGRVLINGSEEIHLASSATTIALKPTSMELSAPKIDAAADGETEISGALLRLN
jgi:type VI secretion system secreted protein VgrG